MACALFEEYFFMFLNVSKHIKTRQKIEEKKEEEKHQIEIDFRPIYGIRKPKNICKGAKPHNTPVVGRGLAAPYRPLSPS